MIGAGVQPRSPSITSTPSMSGSPRSSTIASGGWRAAAASAAAPVRGQRHLVAARAQVDRRAPGAARPRPRRRGPWLTARRPRPRRASGIRSRMVRPPPGVPSATSAPPIASTKPRPRPARARRPPVLVAEPLERLEQPLALRVVAAPGPWSATSSLALTLAGRTRVTSTGPSPPWRSALSTRLASDALEQARVGHDQRQVLGHVDLRRAPARSPRREQRAAPTTSSRRHRLERRRPARRPRRRLASSRLADHRVEPVGGSPRSWRAARRARRRDQLTSVWRSVLTAALIAGKRRAQVVADGGEQRGALAVDGRRAARPRAPRALRRRPSYAVSRRARRTPRSTRWSSANSAGPRPTSRTPGPTGTSKRSGASLPGGAQPACSTSTHSPAGRSRTFSVTDSMRERRRAPAPAPACSVLVLVEVGAGQRRAASRPRRARLLGRAGAPGGELDRAADHRRDGDEHDERERLVARRATSSVCSGVDEEVVDEQRGGDRRRQRRRRSPPTQRDDDHREQVEQHLALERQRVARARRAAASAAAGRPRPAPSPASRRRRLSPRPGARVPATGSSRRSSARTCSMRLLMLIVAYRRGTPHAPSTHGHARHGHRRLEAAAAPSAAARSGCAAGSATSGSTTYSGMTIEITSPGCSRRSWRT